MSEPKKLKLGVLVSGSGSNLQAILDACAKNQIQAEVRVVISNKKDAFALERAKKANVPAVCISKKKEESATQYEDLLIAELLKHQVDFVVLAGFMKILSGHFIAKFKNKILNIHPSLLPAFPGLYAQKQAFDAKVSQTGATVHLVDEGCDTGPIILQATVPVLPDDTLDTLTARILKEEHRLLPKAIDLFAKNKVSISGKKITLGAST